MLIIRLIFPFTYSRQQLRSQFQQPLSAELLSQQQMIKQLQQHQANQATVASGNLSINSPKRVELNASNRQQLLTQTIIHQTYGVQPQQQSLQQAHILAQYAQSQQQQQGALATNMQLRQLSGSMVVPSSYSPPIPGTTNIPQQNNRNLACLQMSYFQQQQQSNAMPIYGAEAVSSQVCRLLL